MSRILISAFTFATILYLAPQAVLSAGPLAFVNGSFEADASGGFDSACTTGLTGWAVHCTAAPPYLINNATYGNTPYGSQFVAIGGYEDNATSWIEQAVSGFTVGNTYTLSWAQSSEYTASDETPGKLPLRFLNCEPNLHDGPVPRRRPVLVHLDQ